MKLQVFSIHDSKAEASLRPFFSPNVAVGQREFAQAVADPDTMFHKYPGDYTLFHLGEWEQDTMLFDLKKTPENLGLALSYMGADQVPQIREA